MRRLARGAVAGGILGALLAPMGAMGQGTDRSFVAAAVASGGYATYGIPGFLIVENYIDGGGPVSQALLDSSGATQSFASLPYPGDTFVKYPGVAAIFLGTAPPGYPLYASASPSQPEQAVGDPEGPFSLTASAAPEAAHGLARTGTADGSQAAAFVTRAESDVTTEAGKITARAVSVAQALSVGPLSVGSVRSVSQTTYAPGEDEATTTTELTVEGGKVGDVSFRVGPEGLSVSDQGVPLAPAQGLTALNTALEPSGMSVRFAEPSRIKGGAAASIFEIVNVADIPGAGKGTLRLRLGGATSYISLGAREGEEFAPVESEAEVAADSGGSPAEEVSVPAGGAPSLAQPLGQVSPAALAAGAVPVLAVTDASVFGDNGGNAGVLVAAGGPVTSPGPSPVATGPADSAGIVNLASPVSQRSGGLGSLADATGPALLANVLAALGVGAFSAVTVAAWRRTRRLTTWTA